MMHTGMMWFDNSKTDLALKIQKAVEYYEKKYNRKPTLVLVHPSMLVDGTGGVSPVAIRPYKPVLPGHIWIGIEDKESK